MKIRPWIVASAFVWTVAGAVALAAYSGHAPTVAPRPVRATTLTKIAWENSFENAMRRARVEGKPLMIDFYADWCGPCKQMDAEVYPDQSVIAQSQDFIAVKINGEKRPDVMQAYGVSGYPTVLFAESGGQPLASVTGYQSSNELVGAMQDAHKKWSAPKAAA